jgi:hypothetical protein
MGAVKTPTASMIEAEEVVVMLAVKTGGVVVPAALRIDAAPTKVDEAA